MRLPFKSPTDELSLRFNLISRREEKIRYPVASQGDTPFSRRLQLLPVSGWQLRRLFNRRDPVAD
jgi:hypothetical protein